MSGSIVMAIALAGLGGHNQPEGLAEPLLSETEIASPYTNPYPQYTVPSSYSGYYSRVGSYELPEYTSHWGTVRSTLWSLILGRDPDVPTVAEIEASVYGDSMSH
jgi:hypothetical protein